MRVRSPFVALALFVSAALAISTAAYAQTPASKPAASSGDLTRTGDVGVGYSYLRGDGIGLPAGFTISNAWRIAKNVDFIDEVGINHGSVLGLAGTNMLTVGGGIRGSSASRYGQGVTAFGQVLVGLAHGSVTSALLAVDESVNAFNIQPGFGVEAAVGHNMAIRPQFDVLLLHSSDFGWGHDFRFGVNYVFTLHK